MSSYNFEPTIRGEKQTRYMIDKSRFDVRVLIDRNVHVPATEVIAKKLFKRRIQTFCVLVVFRAFIGYLMDIYTSKA